MLLQTEDGRLVFGASPDPDDRARRVTAAAVAAVRDRLHAALPAAAGLRVTHAWACHRAAAIGEVPVIDQVGGLDGVWATYGHYRTGFLLAAGTGEALAAWIGGGRPPPGVEPFRGPSPSSPPPA
jgi:glycine oxidase